MKHLKKLATSSLAGIALLTGANFATAQVVTRQNPSYLTGSDTFNRTMDQILAALKASGDVSPNGSGGIDVYSGAGSSAGERQMEGSPSGSEDTCAPNDGNNLPEANPGCQEISPMSRPMDSSICEDDNAAANAEGIAACQDGIVIVAKNLHYSQYAQSAAACTTYNTNSSTSANTSNNPPGANPNFAPYDGVGDWRDSGTIDVAPAGAGPEDYTVGLNGLGWKDIARIVYTGFDNNDGNGTAAAGGDQNRLTRCNSPLRQAVLSSWANLSEGSTCSTGGCTNVVRALRRDDSSGTTQFFVEALGLTPVLTGTRTNLISVGACTAPVTNFTFCDGGDAEVNFPTNDPGIAGADCAGVRGDPIKKPCCADEDICDRNGQMGVVYPVRSPLENSAQAFPVNQCNRNQFARLQYQASSHPVCPDGTVPVAGRCRFPFYNNNGVQDFNCLNSRNSQPPQLPGGSIDGRVYNTVVRTSAGVILNASAAGNMPESGTYRYNASVLGTGIVQGGPVNAVCQNPSATEVIGCSVSATASNCCIIGFAGREAAALNGIDDGNEPFRLLGQNPSNANVQSGAYPFWRYLYVNALNGFENIEADCLAAGHDPDYCADELAIAEEWHDVNNYVPGGSIYNACIAGGVIPLEYNPAQPTSTGPFCVGTQTSSGCGEADDQGCGTDRACSLDQCIPQ